MNIKRSILGGVILVAGAIPYFSASLIDDILGPIGLFIVIAGSIVFFCGLYDSSKKGDKTMYLGKKREMKTVTQEDIDRGIEAMFKGQTKVENKFAPVEKREQIKRAGTPKLTFEPEPEPEPEVEKPYWSGEEWEQWAYSMYKNYPETRQFLPAWFLEALEEALRK